MSSQVDTLSAVVFSTLLKLSLLSYGIDEPESFLAAARGEMLTLRFEENSDRSILVAGVGNRASLSELLKKNTAVHRTEGQLEMFEDSAGEHGAALTDDFVVMGAPTDVRRYVELRRAASEQAMSSSRG